MGTDRRGHTQDAHVQVVQRLPVDALQLAQHFVTFFAGATGKPVKGLSPAVAEKLDAVIFGPRPAA